MSDTNNDKKIIDVDIIKEEGTEEGYKEGSYGKEGVHNRKQPMAPIEDARGMYTSYGEYYDKPVDKTGEGYGITSLVFGIISILCTCCLPIVGLIPCVLAIVFGAIGLKAINRGIAIAGLALGIVSLLPQLLLLVMLITSGGGTFR